MNNKCSMVLALFTGILGGTLMRYMMPPSAFAQDAQSFSPQSAPTPSPKFEVFSIKPCRAADVSSDGGRRGGGRRTSMDPGRLRLECRTLDNLIRLAYIRFANGKGDSLFALVWSADTNS